ncbi:MAG: translation elongation factor G, partial [Clostridiaceae bacterium]|nr:translation elongation factor G [Clostridiaceae bacterium]
QVVVVFDAYRVPGHLEEISDYHNIKVVFTKEAQTADEFIERFAYKHQKKYNITVATSDGLQQIIIRGAGSTLLSARDLRTEVQLAKEKIYRINQKRQGVTRNFLGDSVVPETLKSLKNNEKDT